MKRLITVTAAVLLAVSVAGCKSVRYVAITPDKYNALKWRLVADYKAGRITTDQYNDRADYISECAQMWLDTHYH